MNIINYSLSVEDIHRTVTLYYSGNENIFIRNKDDNNQETSITLPRVVLQKFMEMIDET